MIGRSGKRGQYPRIIRVVRDDRLDIDEEIQRTREQWTVRDAVYRLAALGASVAIFGGTVLVAWALAKLIRR